MMIENGDGTFATGPLDVLVILHDVKRSTYHAAFFEEHPLPGPVPSVEDTDVVRLKSKMHHTGGSPTLEGARAHLADLRKQILVPDANVDAEPVPWDGEIGLVWVVPNWRRAGRQFRAAERPHLTLLIG